MNDYYRNQRYNYGGQYGGQYAGQYNRQYDPRESTVRSEFIPVEQRYTEMVPEQRIEYHPIERSYTDYVEIQHQTDLIPIPRLEKRIEYIPVERYSEHVDYMPVEHSRVVRTPQQLGRSRHSMVDLNYPLQLQQQNAIPLRQSGYVGGYPGYNSPYDRSTKNSGYGRPANYGGYPGYGQNRRFYSPYR